MRALLDAIIALAFGLLPRRRWDGFDLPIQNVASASSLLTCLGGLALGITGFFAYMADVLARREWTAPPFMVYVFVSYIVATPRGLLSLYLTMSGLVRLVSWFIGEPFGDPILTGLDQLVSRARTTSRERSAQVARARLERTDEPDRRYDGEWAGLTGVYCVIVSARRKPEWTKGTWVITNDGWFTLGEPFDRPTPNGLRTVYPLTLQTTTLEVLRKGVWYELPPLRMSTARRLTETPRPSGES